MPSGHWADGDKVKGLGRARIWLLGDTIAPEHFVSLGPLSHHRGVNTMNHHWIARSATVLVLLLSSPGQAAEPAGERFLDLARAGKSTATIVAPDDKAPIWNDAVTLIAATAERWG